jgi:lipid A 3-O-deacylase
MKSGVMISSGTENPPPKKTKHLAPLNAKIIDGSYDRPLIVLCEQARLHYMPAFARLIPLALAFAITAPDAAFAQQNRVDEVRFGLYDHDSDLFSSKKESGADFILEVVSRRITWLEFIGGPRFLVGTAVNTAGQTNQIYLGLIRTWGLFQDVIKPGDAIFLEGTLGGSWHDGKLDVIGTPEMQDWKSHGSRLLFRENIGIGYRFNAKWSVTFNLNHISNAGLADPNEGMNDIGLTLNMKLGDG